MMALTKVFMDTIQARAHRDPAFRKALLQEGVECFFVGDVDTGKAVLRDYINATMGFDELSQVFGKSSKSLMRMFGSKGKSPGEQPVCGDQLSAGAGGDTPGSQSPEGGLGVLSRSVQSAHFKYFEGFSGHGIFHGIISRKISH